MSPDYSDDGYVSLVVCDKYDNCNLLETLEIETVEKIITEQTKHVSSLTAVVLAVAAGCCTTTVLVVVVYSQYNNHVD